MPSKTSKKKVVAPDLPKILKELIDQLVSGPMTAEAVNAASMAFKKALVDSDQRIFLRELRKALGDSLDEFGAGHGEDVIAVDLIFGFSAKTI